jgi:hypothetical protein
MSASLPNAARSQEVPTLDGVRRTPAKATLQSPPQSSPVHDGLLERLAGTVESALIAAHGSQKAAAIEIQIDQSQMRRQLRMGTFDERQMAAAGPAFLAKLGAALVEEFGVALKSPRQQAIEKVAAMQKQLADLQLALGLEE